MDWESWKVVIDLGGFAVALVALVLATRRARRDQLDDLVKAVDLKAVWDRIDEHGDAIATLQAAAKHAPTHQDLQQIRDAVAGVGRDLGELTAGVRAIESLLGVLHQHLLSRDRSQGSER